MIRLSTPLTDKSDTANASEISGSLKKDPDYLLQEPIESASALALLIAYHLAKHTFIAAIASK
jgi:hypothetical protein